MQNKDDSKIEIFQYDIFLNYGAMQIDIQLLY